MRLWRALWAKKATTYKSRALARKTKFQTQFLSTYLLHNNKASKTETLGEE
jgi:hypothetical protein